MFHNPVKSPVNREIYVGSGNKAHFAGALVHYVFAATLNVGPKDCNRHSRRQ